MMQWITAFERIAAASPWARKNRFESFAPVRFDVAAQWLVDGVSKFFFFFFNLIRYEQVSVVFFLSYLHLLC